MITLQLNCGRFTVTVEGDTAADVIKEAELFAALPDKCPLCGSGVHLTFRSPQGFEFFGLACDGPTPHDTTFGEQKQAKGGGLYYKGANSWTVAPRRARDEEPAPTPDPQPPTPPVAPTWREAAPQADNPPDCSECGEPLTANQARVSLQAFKVLLCPTHQQKHAAQLRAKQSGGVRPARSTPATRPN